MLMSVHMQSKGAAKEKHKKYIHELSMESSTTFSVVAGSAGGNLGSNVVLILGFSNLISDGLSMGLGDYISSQAEYDYAKAEMTREKWEFENYAQGEIDEMIDIYRDKGLSLEDATELVNVLAKNKNNFIDTMMVEELGMLPPDPEESPAMGGLVTFIAFAIFGLIPLIPFCFFSLGGGQNFNAIFGISIVLVAVTLFLLGVLTSRFTIHTWYKAGFYMLILGALAAGSSYLIGWGIDTIVNVVNPSSSPNPGGVNCSDWGTQPAPAPLGT